VLGARRARLYLSLLPPSPLALRDKLLYTVGYFGVSVLSGLFLLWANYRYGELFTGAHKAWVGIALLFGRFLDAPSDPIVGWWSDRTKSRLGRRRPFIAYGTVPLVVSFALVWTPPGAIDSMWNIVWLLVVGTTFFTLFSVVVNPYLAMLPDIARTDDDRVTTSAMLAGFGLSAEVLTMVGGSILAGLTSFPVAVTAACVVALVCLMLPLLVAESGSAEEQNPPQLGLVQAIGETLANRPFRTFLLSKCLFWLGIRTVIAIVPFFVEGVLGFAKGDTEVQSGLLLAFAIGPAFVWFAVMKLLVRRYSKRLVSLAGLASLAVAAGLMATVGVTPFDPLTHARVLVAASSFAVAVIFAIPNAILADLVDLDERTTGSRREAMYFGAQGFFVKISWGGASAIVMAAQGAFAGDPAVAARVSWLCVAVAAYLAFLTFLKFPEDDELARMQSSR